MPQLAPHIFDLLYQQGVTHAFGIPGDFALTLYDALADSKLPSEALNSLALDGNWANMVSTNTQRSKR